MFIILIISSFQQFHKNSNRFQLFFRYCALFPWIQAEVDIKSTTCPHPQESPDRTHKVVCFKHAQLDRWHTEGSVWQENDRRQLTST